MEENEGDSVKSSFQSLSVKAENLQPQKVNGIDNTLHEKQIEFKDKMWITNE